MFKIARFQKVSNINKSIVQLKYNEENTTIVCECNNNIKSYISFSPSAFGFKCCCGNEYFGPVMTR